MKWKKDKTTFDAGDIKVNHDEDEEELQDEEYSPWQTASPGNQGRKIFQLPDLPLKTIGIGLLVVITGIIIMVFASGSDDDLYKDKIMGLENRIQLLENQLADIRPALAKKSAVPDLAARLDRLETSIHSRMGQITGQISSLKKQVSAKKTVLRSKNKTSKSTEKTAAKVRLHKVKPGDTLYDIARRYGVTVKQLKQWNKLSSSGRIYPGQKLKVGV